MTHRVGLRVAASQSHILTSRPFFSKMACKQKLGLRCALISDPGTWGAWAKTRLESRIKKCTPPCICICRPPFVPGPMPRNSLSPISGQSRRRYMLHIYVCINNI